MAGLTFWPDRHSLITQKANEKRQLFDADQLRFVIKANMSQDVHQNFSKLHFDNCAFREGLNYIISEWGLIQTSGDKYGNVALAAFGRLLHTVQDFYAHSNWIELHENKAPIPIWDMNLQNLPNGIVSGTWSMGEPKQCADGAPTHAELNKDSEDPKKSPEGCKQVTSGPNQGKTYYSLAFDTAVTATCKQFEQFQALTIAASHLKSVSTPISPDATSEELLSQLIKSMKELKDSIP